MNECIYTSTGLQRYVRVTSQTASFELKGAPAGSVVEFTTVAVPDMVTASKAVRDFFNGSFIPLNCTSGFVEGVTALRVRVADGLEGFCTLTVNGLGDDAEVGCIGALTRINSTLAHMNRDMRHLVRLAA